MPYDPQRSRPRQSIPEDEPAPVDAILDDVAEDASDAEVEAAEITVLAELVEELAADELVIEALAADEVGVDQEVVVEVVESSALPDGVEIEVREDEIVVHTAGADVEVSASGSDVVVHTDDADVDVSSADDIVVVSTPDDDVIVDVSPPRLDLVEPLEPLGDGRGRRRPLVAGAVLAALAVVVVWVLRRRRASGS